MNAEIVRIDSIKWWITQSTTGIRLPIPLCPQHNLKLTPIPGQYLYAGRYVNKLPSTAIVMQCAEGPHSHKIPREYDDEKKYVLDKIDALTFAGMSVLNLDDEAIPVAKENLKESQYWVKSKVTKSKSGDRLIIWAGSRSKGNKTQLFIEPELKRLSFDQNDDHPLEVFAKVEAVFANGATTSIETKSTKK